MDCSLPSSSVHRASPGKNTGVGRHALLQGIFPTQGSNPGLAHCRWILYCLNHCSLSSVRIIYCVNPFKTHVWNMFHIVTQEIVQEILFKRRQTKCRDSFSWSIVKSCKKLLLKVGHTNLSNISIIMMYSVVNLIFLPFYRWRNWGTEELKYLQWCFIALITVGLSLWISVIMDLWLLVSSSVMWVNWIK